MFAIVPKIFSPRTARIRSRYCSGAASEAVADTTMVYFMASEKKTDFKVYKVVNTVILKLRGYFN